jgi:hypothetical protein
MKDKINLCAGDLISAGEQFDAAKELRSTLPPELKNEMVTIFFVLFSNVTFLIFRKLFLNCMKVGMLKFTLHLLSRLPFPSTSIYSL